METGVKDASRLPSLVKPLAIIAVVEGLGDDFATCSKALNYLGPQKNPGFMGQHVTCTDTVDGECSEDQSNGGPSY